MSDVLLRIRASKILEDLHALKRGPLLMEHAVASMHALEKRRKAHRGISLEIGYIDGLIGFFARAHERAIGLIEGQLYAQYPDVDIEEIDAHLFDARKGERVHTATLRLGGGEIYPIKRHPQFDDMLNRITIDPLSGITSTLARYPHQEMRGHIAICFRPINHRYRRRALRYIPLLTRGIASKYEPYEDFFIKVHMARGWRRLLYLPIDTLMGGFRTWFKIGIGVDDIMLPIDSTTYSGLDPEEAQHQSARTHDREDPLQAAQDKVNHLLFDTTIRLSVFASPEHDIEAETKLDEMIGSFKQFDLPNVNDFDIKRRYVLPYLETGPAKYGFVMSNEEIATIWHLPNLLVRTPNIDWVVSKKLEPPPGLPIEGETDPAQSLTTLGESLFRGKRKRFGIRQDDRRRHVYIIGKTGMGKSTLLENMIFSDIHANKGVAVIDPHGDLAASVIQMVPKERTNDIVLFDPSDRDFPISFNMLECPNPEQRTLISSGLMAVFTKLWPEAFSGRMEHILRNTLLALLEAQGNSMLGILRMYADDVFRRKIVSHLSDPLVRSFWENEYDVWSEKYRTEAIAAIQNKIGQLLTTPLIRNIVGQSTSSLSIRHAMDSQKVIVVNLSKGKLGEDNSSFLGSMLVTKFQIDAMSRADIPESERKDFFLYVDEFQNFATSSFATILSEARKYRLSLTMANQYTGQLTPDKGNTMLRDAVFGNVGTLVSFQVGSEDAEEIAMQFGDEELQDDILSLPKYQAYMRLMIDGMTSRPFSVATLAPPDFQQDAGRVEKILRHSRERYSQKRDKVEDKIRKWAESARTARESAVTSAKSKEKDEEEKLKAKKKGMPLDQYRKWRDREMWTNRFNQLKKKELEGELTDVDGKELRDLKVKLDAVGGPSVPTAAPKEKEGDAKKPADAAGATPAKKP